MDVPVIVHTGAGIPFSDPVNLISAAKMFGDVKIVLAHAGTDMFAKQALFLAQEFDNVYIEPSWLGVLNLKKMIDELGPEKIMFSSDLPNNIPVELTKYRSIIKDENDLEQVLSGTVIKVFKLWRE